MQEKFAAVELYVSFARRSISTSLVLSTKQECTCNNMSRLATKIGSVVGQSIINIPYVDKQQHKTACSFWNLYMIFSCHRTDLIAHMKLAGENKGNSKTGLLKVV